VTAPGLICSSLHGDCVELFVVAIEMASEKGDEVRGRGHNHAPIPISPTDLIVTTRAVSFRQRRET